MYKAMQQGFIENIDRSHTHFFMSLYTLKYRSVIIADQS